MVDVRCSKCASKGPDVSKLGGQFLCDRCAEGQWPKPGEYWAKISRYTGRAVMACVSCATQITGADGYYTPGPSQPLTNRRVQCVRCHEGTDYTADDVRRELARTPDDRWRMIRRNGRMSIRCERPNCEHYINAGDNYWETVAGSVERPIRVWHCKRHTAENGIDHDVNMPREAPAGKLGSRRVGLLPEN